MDVCPSCWANSYRFVQCQRNPLAHQQGDSARLIYQRCVAVLQASFCRVLPTCPAHPSAALHAMHPTVLVAQEVKIGTEDARQALAGAEGRTLATLLARPPLGLPALTRHHANLMPGIKGVAAWLAQPPYGSVVVERCESNLPEPCNALLKPHDDDGGRCRALTLFLRCPLPVILVVVYQREWLASLWCPPASAPVPLHWLCPSSQQWRRPSRPQGDRRPPPPPLLGRCAPCLRHRTPHLWWRGPRVDGPGIGGGGAALWSCGSRCTRRGPAPRLRSLCRRAPHHHRRPQCVRNGCGHQAPVWQARRRLHCGRARGPARAARKAAEGRIIDREVSPPLPCPVQAAADLRDAYRELHPGSAGFTYVDWWWRGMPGGIAARFDAVLVSAALMPRVHDVWIAANAPQGDHLPFGIDIDLSLEGPARVDGAGAASAPLEAASGGLMPAVSAVSESAGLLADAFSTAPDSTAAATEAPVQPEPEG